MYFVSQGAKTIASVSVVSMAAFLGACGSLAPKPIDKIENSQRLSDCIVGGMKAVFNAQLEKALNAPAAPGKEEELIVAAMTDESVSQKSSGITMSCISQVSGVSADKIPLVNDQEIFAPFFLKYFDSAVFQIKVLTSLPKVRQEMEDDVLRILKQRNLVQPG